MVNKRVKVHLENTVCLAAHVPKTGLDWTGPLPMVPKCFGTHLSRLCLFDGHEGKEKLIRLFGGGVRVACWSWESPLLTDCPLLGEVFRSTVHALLEWERIHSPYQVETQAAQLFPTHACFSSSLLAFWMPAAHLYPSYASNT